jgi:hypothetical protein
MKKYIPTVILLFFLLVTLLPTLPVHAYGGFVICDGYAKPGTGEVQCNFSYLMKTIVNVFNWLFYISLPIAVGLFAYAGILYTTTVEGNIKKARKIFLNAGIGFIIMLVAFTVVNTVVSWVISSQFSLESATALLKK